MFQALKNPFRFLTNEAKRSQSSSSKMTAEKHSKQQQAANTSHGRSKTKPRLSLVSIHSDDLIDPIMLLPIDANEPTVSSFLYSLIAS